MLVLQQPVTTSAMFNDAVKPEIYAFAASLDMNINGDQESSVRFPIADTYPGQKIISIISLSNQGSIPGKICLEPGKKSDPHIKILTNALCQDEIQPRTTAKFSLEWEIRDDPIREPVNYEARFDVTLENGFVVSKEIIFNGKILQNNLSFVITLAPSRTPEASSTPPVINIVVSSPTPEASLTPTATQTWEPTNTLRATQTMKPTLTPIPSMTPRATQSPTGTDTPDPSATPEDTATPIAIDTPVGTDTPVATPSLTPDNPKRGTSLNVSQTAEGSFEQRKTPLPTSTILACNGNDVSGQDCDNEFTFGVSGEICVTNAGAERTEHLVIFDQVEYKDKEGEYKLFEKAALAIKVERELEPGETHCFEYRIEFDTGEYTDFRSSAHVTILNHSGWMPGSKNCAGPAACPFGPTVKTVFALPMDDTSTPTPIPAEATATIDVGTFEPEPAQSTPTPASPVSVPLPTSTAVRESNFTPLPTHTPMSTAVP